MKSRIAALIAAEGPISCAQFMTLCLHDPEAGYYATRPGLGRDFATSPEISQVFGELVALWLMQGWRDMGSPDPAWLVELGPGRGVMAADMMRTARSLPEFRAAIRLALVETSPALRREQAQRLADVRLLHLDRIEDLPPGPALIVGNEFLDCLPVRQFVRQGGGWRERRVGLGTAGELVWGLGPPLADSEISLLRGVDLSPAEVDCNAIEMAPGLEAFVEALATRLRSHGGRALFIDYGPRDGAPGDTLRGYREGRQVEPLDLPGATDLTADVDFGRLSVIAQAQGLAVLGPVSQREFLLALGALERSDALVRANVGAHPDRGSEIRGAVARLIDPAELGTRFHVMAFAPASATPSTER